jgi:hypothetical protein
MPSIFDPNTLNDHQLEKLARQCDERARQYERKAAAQRKWAAAYRMLSGTREAA